MKNRHPRYKCWNDNCMHDFSTTTRNRKLEDLHEYIYIHIIYISFFSKVLLDIYILNQGIKYNELLL